MLKRLETNSDVDPTVVEIDKKRYKKMLNENQSKMISGRTVEEILQRFDNKIKDQEGLRRDEMFLKLLKNF